MLVVVVSPLGRTAVRRTAPTPRRRASPCPSFRSAPPSPRLLSLRPAGTSGREHVCTGVHGFRLPNPLPSPPVLVLSLPLDSQSGCRCQRHTQLSCTRYVMYVNMHVRSENNNLRRVSPFSTTCCSFRGPAFLRSRAPGYHRGRCFGFTWDTSRRSRSKKVMYHFSYIVCWKIAAFRQTAVPPLVGPSGCQPIIRRGCSLIVILKPKRTLSTGHEHQRDKTNKKKKEKKCSSRK